MHSKKWHTQDHIAIVLGEEAVPTLQISNLPHLYSIAKSAQGLFIALTKKKKANTTQWEWSEYSVQKHMSAVFCISTFCSCICPSSFIHFTSTELQIKKLSTQSSANQYCKSWGKNSPLDYFLCVANYLNEFAFWDFSKDFSNENPSHSSLPHPGLVDSSLGFFS